MAEMEIKLRLLDRDTPPNVERGALFRSVSSVTSRRASLGPAVFQSRRAGASPSGASAMHTVMGLTIPTRPVFMEDRLNHQDDATKLTTFPTPGDPRRRPLVQFEWDGSDEETKRPSSTLKKEFRNRRDVARETGGVPMTIPLNPKQYWMPDKLCKVCYGCDTAFTMFRRRHHCRVCGQIFCHECSSNHRDARALGISESIRMCNTCAEQLPQVRRSSMISEGASSGLFDRRVAGRFPKRHRHSDEGGGYVALGKRERGAQRALNLTTPEKGGDASAARRSSPTSGDRDKEDSEAGRAGTTGGVAVDTKFTNFVEALRNNVETPEETEVARLALEQAAIDHLERLVRQLVAASGGIENSRQAEWSKIIASLVQQAVSTVDPNVKAEDSLDIRRYVKIKLIPGGRRDESRYVDGIVFRKNVSHKKMARVIERPRLLLLDEGIELERRDRLVYFKETSEERDERRIEILATKIETLRPDLLLVKKTISGLAQEKLLRCGVTLVQNVKPSMMEKIARVVGGRIFDSVDIMPIAGNEMGSCARFRVVTFPSPSLEARVAATTSEAGGTAQDTKPAAKKTSAIEAERADRSERQTGWVPPEFRRKRGRGGVTYMFLEGCHKRLGCTLVLRGADCEELKVVKLVVRMAIIVAYNLRLEVSYLNDRRAYLVPSGLPNALTSAVSKETPGAGTSTVTTGSAQTVGGSDGEISKNVGLDGGESVGAASTAALSSAPAATPLPKIDEREGKSSGNVPPGTATAAAAGKILATDGEAAGAVPNKIETPGSVEVLSKSSSDESSGAPGGVQTGVDDIQQDDVQSILDETPIMSSSLGVEFGDKKPFASLERAVFVPLPSPLATGTSAEKASGKFVENPSVKFAEKAGAKRGGGGSGGGGGNGLLARSYHFLCLNQNLMTTHLWMRQETQCGGAQLRIFRYYHNKEDMSLGRFLEDKCFQDPLKCDSPNCKKSVRDHMRSFVHGNGRVDITVGWLPFSLSAAVRASAIDDGTFESGNGVGSDDDTSSWVNSDGWISDGELEEGDYGSPTEGTSEGQSPLGLCSPVGGRRRRVSRALGGGGGVSSLVDEGSSVSSSTSGLRPAGGGLRLRTRGERRGVAESGGISDVSWTGSRQSRAFSVAPSVMEPTGGGTGNGAAGVGSAGAAGKTIYMWSACKKCGQLTTPLVPMSEDTWKFSLGKFLEVTYYNRSARPRGPGGLRCEHRLLQDHLLMFSSGQLIARFEYKEIMPFNIFIRKSLPLEPSFHTKELDALLKGVAVEASDLFRQFNIGLAKILGMAADRQLQDLKGLSSVVEEVTEVRSELATLGSEWLEKMLRNHHVMSNLPSAKKAMEEFVTALKELVAGPAKSLSTMSAVTHEEDIRGKTRMLQGEGREAPNEGSTEGRTKETTVEHDQPRGDPGATNTGRSSSFRDGKSTEDEHGDTTGSGKKSAPVASAISTANASIGAAGEAAGDDSAGKKPLATSPEYAADSCPDDRSRREATATVGGNGDGSLNETPSAVHAGFGIEASVASSASPSVEAGKDVAGAAETAKASPPHEKENKTPKSADIEGAVSKTGLLSDAGLAPASLSGSGSDGMAATSMAAAATSDEVGKVAMPGAVALRASEVPSMVPDDRAASESGAAPSPSTIDRATPEAPEQSSNVNAVPEVTKPPAAAPSRVSESASDVLEEKTKDSGHERGPMVVVERSRADEALIAAITAVNSAADAAAVAMEAVAAASSTSLWAGKGGRVLILGDMKNYLMQFRQRVFWKATKWNDRLAAAGQLLMVLKKVSDRRLVRSRSGRGSGGLERDFEGHIIRAIKHLQQVKKGHDHPDTYVYGDLDDRLVVEQAMDSMLDQVELNNEVSCEVSFCLEGMLDKVEEDYLEDVERRHEVESLLDELVGVAEDRIAAAAYLAYAEEAGPDGQDQERSPRRSVRQLRLLYSSPGRASSQSSASGDIGATVPRSSSKKELYGGRLLRQDTKGQEGRAGSRWAAAMASGLTQSGKVAAGDNDETGDEEDGEGKVSSGGGRGRPEFPKRAIRSMGGENRRSPRRDSKSRDNAKAEHGDFGLAGSDSTQEGSLGVTRKRLPAMGSFESNNSGSPRAVGSSTVVEQRDSMTDASATVRRARFTNQRSRSLSESPVPGESLPTSPRATATRTYSPRSYVRLSPRRPCALSDASSVGSWGIVGEGRSRSSSPRLRASVSPNSSCALSRSPSPQQRAGGIPRPSRISGAGFGGTIMVSPKFRRKAVERPLPGTSNARDSKSGGGGGFGTLPGSVIEATTLSLLNSEEKGVLGVGGSAVAADMEHAGLGRGHNRASGGVDGSEGGSGFDPDRRTSRASSFASEADVAADGRVALPPEDWMQSHLASPVLPQRLQERPTFEDVKALAIAELAGEGGGAGKASGGGSVIGSAAASLATTARPNPNKDLLQPSLSGRKVTGSVGGGPVTASSSRRPTSFPHRMNIQTALARLMGGNWAGNSVEWTVPLGPFAEGRPRLPPGCRGEFIPVFDDQPTTIIAYSLSSQAYHDALQAFYRDGAAGLPSSSNTAGSASPDSQEEKVPQGSNTLISDPIPSSPGEIFMLSGSRLPAGDVAGDGVVAVFRGAATVASVAAAAASEATVHMGLSRSAAGVMSCSPSSPMPMGDLRRSILPPTISIAEGMDDIGRPSALGGGGNSNSNTSGGSTSATTTNKSDVKWWVMNEDLPKPAAFSNLLDNGLSTGGSGGSGPHKDVTSSRKKVDGGDAHRLADAGVGEAGGCGNVRLAEENRERSAGDGGGGGSSVGESTPVVGRRKVLGRRPMVESTGEVSKLEAQMRSPYKTHVKHRFEDTDPKNECKFLCRTFWSTQFRAIRRCYFAEQRAPGGVTLPDMDDEQAYDEMEQGYVHSLCMAMKWNAKGGKSGATFSKTADERFVVKYITKTELEMFVSCAPHYFEYMAKVFFHKLPTVLCKTVGVYQIGFQNRVTGRRQMDQVVVMQNVFYQKNVSRIFDLKGSTRKRYVRPEGQESVPLGSSTRSVSNASFHAVANHTLGGNDPSTAEAAATGAGVGASVLGAPGASSHSVSFIVEGAAATAAPAPGANMVSSAGEADDAASEASVEGSTARGERGSAVGTTTKKSTQVLLDENFMKFTEGQPLPMLDDGKVLFQTAIMNDTQFLNIINIVDYSIVVGMDHDTNELVVGIIDYMRQYDIIKRVERMGKSVTMIAGQAAPTIIQPSQYRSRFEKAMDQYFMTVPDKWTIFHMETSPSRSDG